MCYLVFANGQGSAKGYRWVLKLWETNRSVVRVQHSQTRQSEFSAETLSVPQERNWPSLSSSSPSLILKWEFHLFYTVMLSYWWITLTSTLPAECIDSRISLHIQMSSTQDRPQKPHKIFSSSMYCCQAQTTGTFPILALWWGYSLVEAFSMTRNVWGVVCSSVFCSVCSWKLQPQDA